jgi:drug/metabolite transporter (DMT)-like permease
MSWLLNIGLNALGVALFFTDRFWGRIDKTKEFDWKFWLKDNGQEMTMTALLNASLVLLLYQSVKTESISTLLSNAPDWVSFIGIPGLCLALGAGFSWTVYSLFKSKSKDIEDKLVVQPVVVDEEKKDNKK